MSDPAVFTSGVALSPSDSTVLMPFKGLWVGSAGNVTLTMAGAGNTKVTIQGVAAGALLPLAFVQLWNTGTSAGEFVGFR